MGMEGSLSGRGGLGSPRGLGAPLAGEEPFENLFISAGKVGKRLSRNISLLLGRPGSFSGGAGPPDERRIVASSSLHSRCQNTQEETGSQEGPVGWRRAAG